MTRATHYLWLMRASFAGAIILPIACALLQPKPGDACQTNDAQCQGPTSAIVCRDAKYTTTACKGPQGCSMVSGTRVVSCDQTVGASAGDLCLSSYEGEVECSATESDTYFKCSAGVWSAGRCDAGACNHVGATITCQ